mmetsp:Transcript_53781/g.143078  ORF Transcript_53781/g.143078 Transcript_53781/m.143078 type:complete len:202 (-) Transcript_53781:420-1025(-)
MRSVSSTLKFTDPRRSKSKLRLQATALNSSTTASVTSGISRSPTPTNLWNSCPTRPTVRSSSRSCTASSTSHITALHFAMSTAVSLMSYRRRPSASEAKIAGWGRAARISPLVPLARLTRDRRDPPFWSRGAVISTSPAPPLADGSVSSAGALDWNALSSGRPAWNKKSVRPSNAGMRRLTRTSTSSSSAMNPRVSSTRHT